MRFPYSIIAVTISVFILLSVLNFTIVITNEYLQPTVDTLLNILVIVLDFAH